MTTYFPPIENVPIFDPVLFSIANPDTAEDEYLTKETADKYYLHFPNAQGSETIPSIQVNGTATVNQNIIMSGENDVNYLQFPDTTRQYTAASSQQFQPRFVNYSDYNGASSGSSVGPKITFNGSWNKNDWAMFRINQQASYDKNGNNEWNSYTSTTGFLICRPYIDYMPNGIWANKISYTTNSTSAMGPTKRPLYYSCAINQGSQGYLDLTGEDNTIQFFFTNNSQNGWSTTIEIEYICRSEVGNGTVVFSNGTGSNNVLP